MVLLALALWGSPPASSATQAGLVVIPRPKAQLGLSYFKLAGAPGQQLRAGGIELRNLSARQLRISLVAVNGQTLSTLGSGYASPTAKPLGSTRWLYVARRLVVLAPHRAAVVPVSVALPRTAAPGDYLSGVSVEALEQSTHSEPRKGIAIASVDRYVIGVETSVAGPRYPRLRITGVELQRQPTGLTILLLARNFGNVILQHTFGRALVTDGGSTVAEVGLGPGTFVSGTTIAYPIATVSAHPPKGTVYRVRAYLLYPGGSTRIDGDVRASKVAAPVKQPHEVGSKASSHSGSDSSATLVALLGALAALLLLAVGFLLVRKRRRSARPALAVVEAALAHSAVSGQPLSLISVTLPAGAAAGGELVATVRQRLRQADELCQLDSGGWLVVAADTTPETAEAIAGDLRRQLERVNGGVGTVVAVRAPEENVSAAELLAR
jgi:LPXTG-motif cell wall-anchored protein